MVHIYTLTDPRTNMVRYVGKAYVLGKRLKSHLEDKSETHKTHWIRSLRKIGLKPIIESIETFTDEFDNAWQEAERFWIETLRFYGCKLTNLCSGGLSGSRPSLETREKQSAWQTGRKLTEQHRMNMAKASTGRTHSSEIRLKIKAALTGRIVSDETKAKLSLSHKGNPKCIAAIKKACEAASVKGHSQEWIEQNRQRMLGNQYNKGRKLSQEWCDHLSESKRGKKHSPETIAKMSAARKLWHQKLSPEQKAIRTAIWMESNRRSHEASAMTLT